MKRGTLALLVALWGVNAVQAGEFGGAWLGAKLGYNFAEMTGLDRKNATAFGVEGGYNWEVGSYLMGVGGYADVNGSATHNPGLVSYGSRDLGLDGKFGLNMGNWMPYVKLGVVRTTGNGGASAVSGTSPHSAFGVEYKFTPSLSATGEYGSSSAKNGGAKLINNNLTVGLNYYFGTVAAPAVERVEPRAPVQEVKPVEPPAVMEKKETWKTLLEEKPVTFTGINFDTDSVKLLAGAKARLNDVAEFAKLYPDAQLKISGHADFREGRSGKAYNQKLSERRAETFKAALVARGVPAERIATEGFGFEQPIADNKTKAGRAQNRRVEIRSVIREEKKVRVME